MISAVLALIFAFTSEAMCQSQPDSQLKPEPSRITDEIVVYGKKNIINLRFEIYRAREDFLEMFSSLNSNDDFDFNCDTRIPAGGGPRIQVCKSNFITRYERLTANRGMSRWFQNRIREKEALLHEEMLALVNKHPELRGAMTKLLEAHAAHAAEYRKRIDE